MSTSEASGTGTRGSRILGALVLIGGAVFLVVVGFVLPADEVQRDAARLLPLHVATAWLAYVAFFGTAIASIFYLIPRTRSLAWDRIAGASAEIGVLFLSLLIAVGMIWGNLTWGVFWRWDPRLTTTALLLLLFIGYLALRNVDGASERRARRSAILGVISFLFVPIVHKSVEWWGSLHQAPSVAKLDGDIELDDSMLFSLFLSLVVFSLLYVWLMLHRVRLARLEAMHDARGLDSAIAARTAEAVR